MKAFIEKHGVTKLAGFGDPDFTRLQVERMREYSEAPIAKKAAMLRSGVIP